jgi:hypothetical protein
LISKIRIAAEPFKPLAKVVDIAEHGDEHAHRGLLMREDM